MRKQDVSVFGKDALGGLPIWSYLTLWPYMFVYRCIIITHRLVRRYEPVMTKVVDGYYLSGWTNDYQHYINAGGSNTNIAILDVTCELPRMLFTNDSIDVAYKCVPILDRLAPNTQQLDAAVQWCLDRRAEGRDIIVHCAFGHGRSATCLLGVLLKEGSVSSIDGGEQMLRDMRPHVELCDVQYQALVDWSKVKLK